MKIFIRRLRSFTLVELLVVISIIAIIAGLAFPAFQGAVTRAQLLQTTSNMRQVYLAAQSAALDAAQSGNGAIGWPADMVSNTPSTPVNYFIALGTNGYFASASDFKVLAAPGYPALATTNYSDLQARNNAYDLGNVSDSDPGTAIFLYTKNWTASGAPGAPATGGALTPGAKPFGDKGFVIFHKGGDGQALRKNMATDNTGALGTAPTASKPWITE